MSSQSSAASLAGITCSRCGGVLLITTGDLRGDGGGDPSLLLVVPVPVGCVPDPRDEDRLCHQRCLRPEDFDPLAIFVEGMFERFDVRDAA